MKSKRNLARVAALLLAALLCLTACSGPIGPSSQGTEYQGPKYWEMLDSVSDTSELPSWEGETLEVSVWFAAASSTVIGTIPETDVCFKEFERVTGVKFDVDRCFDNGGTNIDAKLPMVIASKDLPTLIMGYDIKKQCIELWEEGYLADLTEYYEDGTLDQVLKYMPFDDAYNYVYTNYADEDGNMFLLPNGGTSNTVNVWEAIGYEHEDYDPVYFATYGMSPTNYNGMNSNKAVLVRDDILTALFPDAMTMKEIEEIYLEKGTFTEEQIFDLGMDSPEDFWEMLYDIQELVETGNYVGVDGKPVEVMAGPHTETDNWYWMVNLPNAINGAPDGTEYFISADYNAENENELLSYAYSSDYYVNWMKQLNKLVCDDVIAQSSLLDSSATFNEKCKNGHYAVLYGGQYYPYGDKNDEGWSYRPIYVDTPYNYSNYGGFSNVQHSDCIGVFEDTLNDAQMDQLMHAINYLHSEVGIKNFYWGPRSAGLFTEDENGNRSYTMPELVDCMITGVDNGYATDYGIYNTSVAVPLYSLRPMGLAQVIYQPKYLSAGTAERIAVDANRYFCPGTLEGHSLADNATILPMTNHIYQSGLDIEGIQQFWDARAGFENQMKKVVAALTDEEFERELQELYTYAEQNGLDEDTLQEFTDKFMEANLDALKEAGFFQ